MCKKIKINGDENLNSKCCYVFRQQISSRANGFKINKPFSQVHMKSLNCCGPSAICKKIYKCVMSYLIFIYLLFYYFFRMASVQQLVFDNHP